MTKPKPIDECDLLRTPERARHPDARSAGFVLRNRETGETRRRHLADDHEELKRLVLYDAVPRAVRVHFETAKNLLLYAWFCWRFMQVAEVHVLGTVEMALRRRMGVPDDDDDAPGLAFMLKHAVGEGWIRDEGLRHVERLRTTPPETIRGNRVDRDGVHVADMIAPLAPDVSGYAQMLATELPKHRNTLAHGSEILDYRYSYVILELCCDIINQLFRATSSSGAPTIHDGT